MRAVLTSVFLILAAAFSAQADIAPPYPEFHTGIQIQEAEPFPKISRVDKGSPAEKAGAKVGDHVLALNGSYSKPRTPFYFWLKGLRGEKNSKMQLIVLRNEAEVMVLEIPRTISVR